MPRYLHSYTHLSCKAVLESPTPLWRYVRERTGGLRGTHDPCHYGQCHTSPSICWCGGTLAMISWRAGSVATFPVTFLHFPYDASAFSVRCRPSGEKFLNIRATEVSDMVGTCANPASSARFHTLQRGKLFEVETTPDTELVAPAGKPPKFPPIPRRIYSLWPCGANIGNLRVIYDRRNGISVEPLPMVASVASRAADAGNNLKRKHDRASAEETRVPTVGSPYALAQFQAPSSMDGYLCAGVHRVNSANFYSRCSCFVETFVLVFSRGTHWESAE
jgi:hypothetical protein